MSPFEPAGIVTLLTDFGLSDTYAGQMKGVLLGIDPTIRIVDLTHQVSPQNVAEAAFHLAAAVDAFPAGCVHLAVVDPGVGTARRAIVVQTDRHLVVCPDNGLVTLVAPEAVAAFEISPTIVGKSQPSSTFHGRDVFAPVAGRLASGQLNLEEVGPSVGLESLGRVRFGVVEEDGQILGTIVSIDHFGNCITLIGADSLPESTDEIDVRCGSFRVSGLSWTYETVDVGEPLTLIGSHGTLELSIRDGDVARSYGLALGDRVVVSQPAAGRGKVGPDR
ncbi:hypothetical protein BH23CHL2_BH23CHL2_28700 [soil metagenome]